MKTAFKNDIDAVELWTIYAVIVIVAIIANFYYTLKSRKGDE